MKLRTIVLTVVYDEMRITDPVEWLLPKVMEWAPAPRYRIVGAATPAIYAAPVTVPVPLHELQDIVSVSFPPAPGDATCH